MKFIRELLEAQEDQQTDELPEVKPDNEPAEISDEEPTDDDDGDEEFADDDDIGSVSVRQGYDKEKTEMNLFGAVRPVTILSKVEEIDDKSIETQYLINPKTGAWVYKVGLSKEDMIEIKNGEDPSSLLRHLKRKTKISSHQVSEYFG
jgi:N-methylhydantoinase A/oxoprolinase/acetone carboxylase beta subunit